MLLLSLIRAAERDREALVAENLLLRHQLAVLTRPTRKRPRLRARDKLFRVVARALCRDWRRHLVVVRPESVIRWHRQTWRLLWRWRSRHPIGHPRLSAEVCDLIAATARDNDGLDGFARRRGIGLSGSSGLARRSSAPAPSRRPFATRARADPASHPARPPGAPQGSPAPASRSGTPAIATARAVRVVRPVNA
jgi:hypothetical protein